MRPLIVAVATAIEGRLFPRTSSPVVVVQCGLGPERARAAVQTAMVNGARGIVSFGFAGGIAPTAVCGLLLLPRRIRGPSGENGSVDPGWHGRVLDRLRQGTEPNIGDLLQVSAVIARPAAKRDLNLSTAAVAVDMESGALAAVAQRTGTPFLALRIVLDGPDDCVPTAAAQALTAGGKLQAGALLAALGRSPGQLPALIHLALRHRRAGHGLSRAALIALPELLNPGTKTR